MSKNEITVLPGQQITATARAIKTKEARVAALLLLIKRSQFLHPLLSGHRL